MTDTCGHTKVGATGITWICTAPPGPLSREHPTHSHYYVNKYPGTTTPKENNA